MATRKQPPKRRGATTSRRTTRSAPRREWRLPGWLWGLAGLVAGFLLSQHQHGVAPWQVEDSPLATVLPRSAPPSEPAAPAAPSEPRMPTFEFYTLLPESEVIAPRGEMPASTARPPAPPEEPAVAEAGEDPIAQVIAANLAVERNEPAPAAAEPAPASAAGHRYMLQAASFREPGDAQQLRGRLRDFGLLAQISEVKAGGGETWHRVQVGPYEDDRELSRAQDLMVTQGIEPLLIRLNN
ncbi:cell division septation protein DedD [Halomonas campaniensis]|uniref:Cell division septation protein DedD n=1 Tax=Halomonas campaniensis TaxID=213554 RepID=A0A7W5K294_9GAMM|nr:SPOR domain-containing protein [Halomonas campaniensis]MBB3330644.1 cell division septation protein DedD [Halomonas campaniensis]